MIDKFKKLAVVGSRLKNETDEDKASYKKVEGIVNNILDRFYDKYKPTLFISGGAYGVDSIAEEWAKYKNNLSRYIIVPDWYPNGKYFKGAGFVRNKNIIEASDIVIAFTSGSNGTANSIEWGRKLNKPTVVFDLEGKLVEKFNI